MLGYGVIIKYYDCCMYSQHAVPTFSGSGAYSVVRDVDTIIVG